MWSISANPDENFRMAQFFNFKFNEPKKSKKNPTLSLFMGHLCVHVREKGRFSTILARYSS